MAKPCRIIFDDPERDTRVVAYADRYAADRHGELYFLSVGGESMAVRAVLAALASRHSVTVEGSTQHSWLMFGWGADTKFRTVRLQSGLAQGVICARGQAPRDVRPGHLARDGLQGGV